MSIPKNHHYVSQCQIRNFFNREENKIFLYDKKADNIYSKTTTKSVFSERELNTVYENGQIDHETIEKDLRDYFEESFTKNLAIIKAYVETEQAVPGEIHKALFEITKLGMIGKLRNPVEKKHLEDSLFEQYSKLFAYAAEPLKSQYEQVLKDREMTKYSNKIIYSAIAEGMLKVMLPITSVIYNITTANDYFLLPDCSAITSRGRINDYFNPDIKEIANVGVPLASKLLVQTFSAKHIKKQGGIFYLGDGFRSRIDDINRMMVASSVQTVACESREYLENFVRETKINFRERGFDISKTYNLGDSV